MGKVRCTHCGDVLHNDDRLHDMLICSCGCVSYDYHPVWPRIGFKEITDVEIWDEKKKKWGKLGGCNEQLGTNVGRKNKAGGVQ